MTRGAIWRAVNTEVNVMRRTRKEWSALVVGLERSGESVRSYASRRGVNARTLGWWRWRLRRDRERGAAVESSPSFVPVSVAGWAGEQVAPMSVNFVSGVAATSVEVGLPNGVQLRFEMVLDSGRLHELGRAFGAV